jgi:hypothetical protein
MIEICVPTLFAESPDKWRLRDRVFVKAALDFTDTGLVVDHRLIFAQPATLAKIFAARQE